MISFCVALFFCKSLIVNSFLVIWKSYCLKFIMHNIEFHLEKRILSINHWRYLQSYAFLQRESWNIPMSSYMLLTKAAGHWILQDFLLDSCGILWNSCRMLWILVEQSCCWNSQYPYGLLLESWKFFRDSPGILQAFFSHSSGILQEFFGDSPGIFQAFFRHSSGILQEFFMNSSGILQEFFRHSSGILQEFFRNFSRILQQFFSNSSGVLQAFFRHSLGILGMPQ